MEEKSRKQYQKPLPSDQTDPGWNTPVQGARKALDVDRIFEGLRRRDRVALGQGITLVESTLPAHQLLAHQLVERCLPYANQSIRIGITGAPGVGKSSFIEALGVHILNQDRLVAVLAVDPSSRRTKGSILGDKTRMAALSTDLRSFIRPSPAGSSLGGVARATRESIILCEAAGYDTIIVETVGVGQSEIAVHSLVDFFLLLLLPGAGDELQGIKRGIVEIADLLVVNKADGDRIQLARQAQRAYANAVHLYPPKENGWAVKVLTCSALENRGIAEIWTLIQQYFSEASQSGYLQQHRKAQAQYWLKETLTERLLQIFQRNPPFKLALENMEKAVEAGRISPFRAAEELIEMLQQDR